MYNPISTYRFQFHKDFTFNDFEKVIPYLQKLGITTVYASPIFTATPGSTHGYDQLNPHQINPEIGTEEQLKDLTATLKKQNMGWLQDIVPNHMAFSPLNTWLMDVLEKGKESKYATFFDINWDSTDKIMVPFLGVSLKEAIKNKEITIALEEEKFVVKYYDSAYPLHASSYATILGTGKETETKPFKKVLEQVDEIVDQKDHNYDHNKALEEDEGKQDTSYNSLRQNIKALMETAESKTFIETRLEEINNDPNLLQKIMDQQVYRLCSWQETDHRINFRRFFTVNGLICINIQERHVFDHYHKLVKRFLEDGTFNGLRIDHIDGLYNPTDYLHELRKLAGDETYIVVEKILEPGEALPAQWPIEGNTGYDFLSLVNNLFTNKAVEERFTDFYFDLIPDGTSVQQQIHDKKGYILYEHMGGELENLYQLFMKLDLAPRKKLSAIHPEDFKTAIGEILIQCPVYRYYGNHMPLDNEESSAFYNIINNIRKKNYDLRLVLDLIEETILRKPHEHNHDLNKRIQHFYQRLMQFSGPLMAKGVEDTLMYTYNRFIVHNEVGDAPEAFGLTPDEFHHAMKERQEHWPLSMNATSTHDTKRGEDVRARLNVLTDLSEEWLAAVESWLKSNASLKEDVGPDSNDEYFIYQTIMGAYPMPGQDEDNFEERLHAYLEKAFREGKINSNWTEPNEAYETAAKNFASKLLDQKGSFWKSFSSLHQKVADYGVVNSLVQVLLKFTCPGVPDVYQGCELWDLSMVDPDNRRPVDFEKRQKLLNSWEAISEDEQASFIEGLWENRFNAHIKLWLVHQLLKLRQDQPVLFSQGKYIPLKVEGTYKDNVFAFARKYNQTWYVIAAPLHVASMCSEQKKEVLKLDWADTKIMLPKEVNDEWDEILTASSGTMDGGVLVKDLFTRLPFAIVKMQQEDNERGAGILVHITSLPAHYGVGDLGPSAFAFAESLYRSQQKYWQMLPLNPTEAGQGHSPYSAISSRAGNPLLISPDLLVKDDLITEAELTKFRLPIESKADYAGAEKAKAQIFETAFHNFRQGHNEGMKHQFHQFCEKEKEWLDDFALYMVLKKEHEGKPWFQWPEEHKLRDQQALDKILNYHYYEVKKIKWLQFIFMRQWRSLKSYCNYRGIKLIGDLPIYVSYDSVDVWSNREIFSIDEQGNMTGVAGVPPDAFSDDGQLWGMPVYKWDVLKDQDYSWWVNRLRKNMELFDLIRLDHFRAFADYWEVPATEKTAKNGQWKQGPRSDFFNTIEKELGKLPFIAEDLGDINEDVYALRDEFNMPGMNVLQFAFGEDMPHSVYIPHNYIPNSVVYTGTHDNNTTVGWMRQEVNDAMRQRINDYVGMDVQEHNVHMILARLAYSSVARTAILPLQDVLGLDENARMNIPASAENNWAWRLTPNQFTTASENILRKLAYLYNRE